MLRRLPLVFCLLFCAVALLPRSFGATANRERVKASLVAADASVQPGKPLTVAIRLVHDEHWHTYWVNPGTGLATTLEWKLPAGWKAGDIQWPAPVVLRDRTKSIIGNGYEGDTLLPVTLTPPADLKPGEKIELKVDASWLMCEEVCVPGEASLALSLPVTAEAAQPDATWGAKIRDVIAGLPRADPAWKATATRNGKALTLTVTPADAAKLAGHTPKDLHFFSDNNLTAYEIAPEVKSDGRGGFILAMQASPDGPSDAAKLTGVITSSNGWLPGGTLRGLQIAAEFAKGSASPVNAGGASAAGTSGGSTAGPGGAAAGSSGAGQAAPAVTFATLFAAFVGGLILNLMPCVFPVLGLKILGFVNQAGSERSKVVGHGLVFTLGVLLSFWALAGVLIALRARGEDLGWGFQLQSPGFVFVLAVLMLVFALNLSGVFEFGLGATAVGSGLQSKSGYAGSFFTGVLATVVATPCSGPFVATALGVALTVPPLESFGLFTAIALGLSTPYLLLSVFPALVKFLPRPGAWMETFKQFMAFPLYATVGLLLWVLVGQISEESQFTTILGLVLVAMAMWFYGRYHAPGAKPARARFGTIALVVVGAAGLWLGWPKALVVSSPGTAVAGANAAPAITWEKWSPEAVAKLREEGKIVYVDFTARWCFTCQTNKKAVFGSSDVLKAFADKKIVTLRADWTNHDPAITAELARYQRSAVPFNVIWAPGKAEPTILPELLTPGIVLDAIKAVERPVAVTSR